MDAILPPYPVLINMTSPGVYDETALTNTDVRGRSFAPAYHTPVALCVGGGRHKLSMIASVTNQGKPIPKEALQHLFQPYSRPASNTPQAGLGLGLYIADQIALSHGGRIEAASDEQHGTVFSFSFSLPANAGDFPHQG